MSTQLNILTLVSIENHIYKYKYRKLDWIATIDDSPYYVFVALCIVVIVVSLIFKMAYFCPDPCKNFKKKLGSDAR
jgi:hypothetical protein